MAQLLLVNPKKRTRRTTKKRRTNPIKKTTSRRRRRNPIVAVKRSRRRRNPVGNAKVNLMANVKSAAMSAAGALILDVAYAYLPVPSQFKTDNMKHVGKIGVAFALGFLGQKAGMLKGAMARSMVEGAMTVTIHDAMKGFLATAAPSIRMSSVDDEFMAGAEYIGVGGVDDLLLSESPINRALSAYDDGDDEMGEFVNGIDDDEMGEFVGDYSDVY